MTIEQAQTEQSLVLSLKAGSKEAIARLYDAYSAALYGIISRIVVSENLAEEVLQDTFVKIWNNIESYDASKGTLFTWMRRIAHNTSIDMLRQKERQPSGLTLDGNEGQINAQFQNSIAVDTIGVRHLLERLRPEYQQVIDMLYFQGYTQQEVSDELNIPLGTVKTRTRAALGDLRKLFATIIVLLLILSWLS
jgi:RNA polymerase sigma-70 factor, ECF subfamily